MSNLLLARHLNRAREMALRASLGATRGRLVRQLLTEALILCLGGTAAGFVAGRGLLSMSHDLFSDSQFKALIAIGDQAVDMRIVAFTILLSLFTTVLFGLIPALHFTRTDLNEALKSSPGGQAMRPRPVAHQSLPDRSGIGRCLRASDRRRIAGTKLCGPALNGPWLHRRAPIDRETPNS